jgi:DNA-binding MarR family transcriptional regulator
MQASRGSGELAAVDSAELARRLAGFFHFLATASSREFLPEISDLDLSLTQLKSLALLREQERQLAVKDLSEGLGLSVAATSRTVDGLVKRRLVDRDEDPVDRRVKRVRLTARGQRMIERVVAVRVVALRRVVDSLSEEQRTKLEDALEALLANPDIRRQCPPRRNAEKRTR